MSSAAQTLEQIAERLGTQTPLIAVGNVWSPEDAIQALNLGASFVASGRAFLLDPEWVQKVEAGRSQDITTTVSLNDREALTLPEPLWKLLTGFKVKDRLTDGTNPELNPG